MSYNFNNIILFLFVIRKKPGDFFFYPEAKVKSLVHTWLPAVIQNVYVLSHENTVWNIKSMQSVLTTVRIISAYMVSVSDIYNLIWIFSENCSRL
jgi:hypothetical protein